MASNCELKDQLAQPTLTIRTRSAVQNLPQTLGQAYREIGQYLGELGEPLAGPPFVIYYNMDMQDLDVEAGFPVSHKLPGKDAINASEIPAGKVAACLYTGPYVEMGSAYEALVKWIQDHGYQTTGVVYEIYLNDPRQTPPQELQTQIVFPLK